MASPKAIASSTVPARAEGPIRDHLLQFLGMTRGENLVACPNPKFSHRAADLSGADDTDFRRRFSVLAKRQVGRDDQSRAHGPES